MRKKVIGGRRAPPDQHYQSLTSRRCVDQATKQVGSVEAAFPEDPNRIEMPAEELVVVTHLSHSVHPRIRRQAHGGLQLTVAAEQTKARADQLLKVTLGLIGLSIVLIVISRLRQR